MKSVEEQAMGSTATIYKATFTLDVMGSYTESWVSQGTVACDVWPISKTLREQIKDSQRISESDYYISFPIGTGITVKDRAEIDSITYEITFVPLDVTWATNLRCEAKNYNEEQRMS